MFTVTNVFNQHELYFGQTLDSILLCYFVKALCQVKWPQIFVPFVLFYGFEFRIFLILRSYYHPFE